MSASLEKPSNRSNRRIVCRSGHAGEGNGDASHSLTGFRGFWRVFGNVPGEGSGERGINPRGRGKTPARSREARFFELELLDPVTNLIPVQAQERGGARLVPAGPLERLNEQRSFELFEIDAGGRQLDLIA